MRSDRGEKQEGFRVGVIWILSGVMFIYIFTYLSLSFQGNYAPAILGLGRVKSYGWSPKYFTYGPMQDQWREPLLYAFLPLYFVDTRLWHTSEKARKGKYPINTALADELQKWVKQSEQNQSLQ